MNRAEMSSDKQRRISRVFAAVGWMDKKDGRPALALALADEDGLYSKL